MGYRFLVRRFLISLTPFCVGGFLTFGLGLLRESSFCRFCCAEEYLPSAYGLLINFVNNLFPRLAQVYWLVSYYSMWSLPLSQRARKGSRALGLSLILRFAMVVPGFARLEDSDSRIGKK